MKRIKSKKPGLKVKHRNPDFEYTFGHQALTIPDDHAEVILRNPTFFEDKKSVKYYYSRKELLRLKMQDLRKVGNKFKVKDTDKKELIEEIMKAQEA